jgi:hypothetical protein
MGKWWEKSADSGILPTMTEKKRPKSAGKVDLSHVWLPWEEFTSRAVTIEELRERAEIAEGRLALTLLLNPSAPTLDRATLHTLIASADLAAGQEAALERDLAAIGFWYLTPGAQVAADADLDGTRRYLRDLKKLSSKISPSLNHVLSLLPKSILNEIGSDPSLAIHGQSVDFSATKDFIKDLPILCDKLMVQLSPKQVGRRHNFVLDHSAKLARDAISAAGLSLKARFRNPEGKLPELTGSGASLVWDYFKSLNPRLGESELTRAVIRVQRSTVHKTPSI